jgi:uncharacterized iron-regulated membrane protein
MKATKPSSPRRPWPDYRAVWRWHFYAGLFCIPFVAFLAITGSIYLFRPQIEPWLDRPYDHLVLTGHPASAEARVGAALAAVPGSVLHSYELPNSPNAATQIIVKQQAEDVRVYVHPETLRTLKTVKEMDRLMNVIFYLHGELLMKNTGSAIVELAASWAILMIVTGLYLWWPRQGRGLAGILYPRFNGGTRLFWRDLHAVTGVWISSLALFLLVTGLPWAFVWGSYLQKVRDLTHTAVAKQDWPVGHPEGRPAAAGSARGIPAEHSAHMAHAGWRRRPQGVLGAPDPVQNPRFSFGLGLLILAFGIYLPLFGLSMIVVKLVEKLILSRIPAVRDWLGLSMAATRSG